MDNHNIGWMMGAVIIMTVLALVCGHFGIGVSNNYDVTAGVPHASLGVSTVSWLFSAMTFQLTDSYGIWLTAITWFLTFIILWCVIPLIIAGIQALGTWVP